VRWNRDTESVLAAAAGVNAGETTIRPLPNPPPRVPPPTRPERERAPPPEKQELLSQLCFSSGRLAAPLSRSGWGVVARTGEGMGEGALLALPSAVR